AAGSARSPQRARRGTLRVSSSWSPPHRRRPPPPPPRPPPPPPPPRDGAERDIDCPAPEPRPPLEDIERWLDCPRLASRCPPPPELAPLNALLREPDDMLELDGRDAPLAPPKLPWPPPRAPVL